MQNAQGSFRYISGDTDWVHFSFLDGSPLDPDTAFRLFDAMTRCCGLQHPETISWLLDGQTVFREKANQIGEYLCGQKALLEVSSETTRAVRIDPNLSSFASNGRGHLIFFERGLKSRTRATLAEVESAFAFMQAKFPDRRLILPFLWADDLQYLYSNSNDAVVAGQASGSGAPRRLGEGEQIELFNGTAWVATDISSLPSPVKLVPSTITADDAVAGAITLPLVNLPLAFPDELAGRVNGWFATGQTIIIAPGEPSQEIRVITDFGTMTLDQPLKFAHPSTTRVSTLPATILISNVSISGRVTTPDGRGLRNAQVILTNAAGVRRSAVTSSFGFYTFTDVGAGQTYSIAVRSRRYKFASRSVSVLDTLTGVDFVATE
jgi:hypothetical protein